MIRRRTLTWIVGLVCFLTAKFGKGGANAQDDPLRHGHALIIGAWDYSDAEWPRLDDIRLQIHQLQTALTPHFDDVQLLQNPTFDQLDSGLRRFLRILGNNDNARLLIYYAGHGYTEVNADRNSYRGYITGSDTPYVDGTQRSFAAARVKALSMEAVRGLVSDVNARQLLFIFDSCFAGTVFTARSPSSRTGRLSESDISRLLLQPVREFITAGDIQERIPAHSPIPQLLINALSGDADPYDIGVVTGQQISQYFWTQTRGLGISPREGKLPGGSFDRGEFLFRVGLSVSPPPRFAPPAVEPTPALVPVAPLSRAYLVFFDWDKAVVTPRARQIVQEAAYSSTKVQYSRIRVNGYTDTSQPAGYSLALTVRMAQAVAAELVAAGVPQSALSIQGFGSTHLLVPTDDGVREPQNRRVEIVIE